MNMKDDWDVSPTGNLQHIDKWDEESPYRQMAELWDDEWEEAADTDDPDDPDDIPEDWIL